VAIPWTALASAIPWSKVIASAPEVLRGASKLWQRVGKKAETPAEPASPGTPAERIAALESRCRELEARAQESADVLAQVAEQQSGLIAEVARLHRQTRRLLVALVVLGVILAAGLIAPLH
jgi:hypothetical protein